MTSVFLRIISPIPKIKTKDIIEIKFNDYLLEVFHLYSFQVEMEQLANQTS